MKTVKQQNSKTKALLGLSAVIIATLMSTPAAAATGKCYAGQDYSGKSFSYLVAGVQFDFASPRTTPAVVNEITRAIRSNRLDTASVHGWLNSGHCIENALAVNSLNLWLSTKPVRFR